MADLTDSQRDTLIRTVLGEARGEGMDGMAAVAQVIRNRANSGQYPNDPAAVALQPYQFSTWNTGEGGNNPQQFSPNSAIYQRAGQVVDAVFNGEVPDLTNGALFYHTPQVNPNWSSSVNRFGTTRLGNHIFYNGRPTPPGEIPNVVASWTDTTRPRNPSPATQSNTIAAQRSLIPSDASPALKAALARLASQSVQAVPVTQSPDLAQMRNPAMSTTAQDKQVTPYPRTASPRLSAVRNIGTQQGAPYNGIFGGTRLPPVANPGQDNVGAYPTFSQLRGLMGSVPNNAPVPATPSLVTRTMRALGPAPANLQQALNASVQPRVAPVPMPASARPREPGLKIVVNGANPITQALAPQRQNAITPVQALMGQGLTSAQAYNALAAAAQGAPTLEDRITGRSTSSGGGTSSISSW